LTLGPAPAEQIEREDFVIAPDGLMWRMQAMSTATETMQPSARGARGFLPRACSGPAAGQRLASGGLKSKFLSLYGQ